MLPPTLEVPWNRKCQWVHRHWGKSLAQADENNIINNIIKFTKRNNYTSVKILLIALIPSIQTYISEAFLGLKGYQQRTNTIENYWTEYHWSWIQWLRLVYMYISVQYKHTYVIMKNSIYTVGDKGNSGLNNLRMDFSFKIITPVHVCGNVA